MPIFEYTCDGCGAAFEMLVRSSEVRVACPMCGSGEVAKQFSSFAVATAERFTSSVAKGCGCAPAG